MLNGLTRCKAGWQEGARSGCDSKLTHVTSFWEYWVRRKHPSFLGDSRTGILVLHKEMLHCRSSQLPNYVWWSLFREEWGHELWHFTTIQRSIPILPPYRTISTGNRFVPFPVRCVDVDSLTHPVRLNRLIPTRAEWTEGEIHCEYWFIFESEFSFRTETRPHECCS